jgi:acyl dehydratase
MALDPKFVGKSYGPYRYTLGLEKMREFAYAVSGGVPSLGLGNPPEDLDPLYYDEEKAKAGPYGSVIAFPSFAVTFALAPFGAAIGDPALGIDLVRLLHAEQEFEFLEVMRPGDVMTTTGQIASISSKKSLDFMVIHSESVNQHGKLAVRGVWTAVIRNG